MRIGELRNSLVAGQTVFGTLVFEFNTPGISLIAAEAGASFVLFDMEHTGWSIESIRAQMAWSRAAAITRLVRVPATQYDYISRALDVGAQGVMIPMVESREQAERMRRLAAIVRRHDVNQWAQDFIRCAEADGEVASHADARSPSSLPFGKRLSVDGGSDRVVSGR